MTLDGADVGYGSCGGSITLGKDGIIFLSSRNTTMSRTLHSSAYMQLVELSDDGRCGY
jgi:hypothetical protein